MVRVFRFVALALVGVMVLVAAAAAGGLWWLRGEQPAYTGTVRLAGLDRPVEVLRDANGVPHIFAESDADAAFALGYVHAQDRLWQMELMRRIGSGRLAELFGTRFGAWPVGLDRQMRTLGFAQGARDSYAALSPGARRDLDAYAAGVNAYLASRTEALPVEFQLLRHEPAPWTPADSLVWGKLMALQLSGNYRQEIQRARLLRRLTPEQVADLYPGDPEGSAVTLAALLDGFDFDRVAADLPPALGPDLASNEWVLSGPRTTTGKPILANDPHLGLEAPILWYLARIVTPERRLVGATVPGTPLMILGHNGRVAWGFTTTHSDTQDLFIERIDPADPNRYLTPGGSEPFEVRTEIIRVAGAPDVELTVRRTRHGPVISDLPDEGSDLFPAGHVLALAFAGIDGADTTAEALYLVNRATSAAEVRDALRLHRTPQQNVVFADTAGAIGLVSPALVPIRRNGDGSVPVPGWTGEYDWAGFIPYDELPHAADPESGRIVNANNAVVGPDYPHLLTTTWPEPHRADRIIEMLGDGTHDVDATVAHLMDAVSPAARRLLPLMLQVPAPAAGPAAEAVAMLRQWDATMDRNRPEPLIYEWWLRELNRTLFADELGDLFGEYFYQRTETVYRALSDRRQWCDDVRTPTVETCGDALASSLDAALARLRERHGTDPAAWRWGDEHRAPLSHRVLGRVPGFNRVFGLEVETDGSGTTVNRGTSRISDEAAPFAHVHGAGFRAVYDLSDLPNSRFVIATGQSGNPFSPHWGDFVERWSTGGMVMLRGDRAALAAAGARRLVLQPARPGGSS
ncbi:penicillin acylase family protein [Azospirillum halopraeferens]|uniref:penicillin acylase family protein n=1 Tax=Azospirillum halopraeferens TaxID=34010 RepID=UPI000421414A|nr:penicillin acylase family protein [Azospirillum halopraeferens]